MRYRHIVVGVLMAGLVLNSVNCKKEPSASEETITVQSFFNLEGGTYQGENFPESHGSAENRPYILHVEGDTLVVPGGRNELTVTAADLQSNLALLFVGLLDLPGYFSIDWTAKSLKWSDEGTMTVTLTFQSDLPQDTFVVIMAVKDEDGYISSWYQIPMVVSKP